MRKIEELYIVPPRETLMPEAVCKQIIPEEMI